MTAISNHQEWREASEWIASVGEEKAPMRNCFHLATVAVPELIAEAKQLEEENARLREALKPFADEAAIIAQAEAEGDVITPDDMSVEDASIAGTPLTMGDLRHARAALSPNQNGGQK